VEIGRKKYKIAQRRKKEELNNETGKPTGLLFFQQVN
jgi:hypothetical protein